MAAKSIVLVVLFSCALQFIHAAKRVNVEDLVADVKLRFADDFKRRADDGDPPGLEDLLELPKEEDLKRQTTVQTVKNVVKTKFKQLYENIPVFGSHITAAEDEKTGESTEEVTGVVIKNIEDDVKSKKPEITEEQALEIAKKHHGHKDIAAINSPDYELKIYFKDDKAHLAYFVSYLTSTKDKNLTQPITVVDAKNKKVIDSWEGLTTAFTELEGYGGNTHIGRINFTGAAGQLGKLNLTVDENDESRCLLDNSYFRIVDLNGRDLSAGIFRHFLAVTAALPTLSVDCDTEPIPNNELRDAFNVANDIYYFLYHSFKMYESFNLTAYNRKLEVWFNFTQFDGNAAAFRHYVIVNNGGGTFYPLSSYADVLAHELGHSFTKINSNLKYAEESGGMNEAFSDMSGETFKNYLYGENNWIIGENVYRNPRAGRGLRYMDNPPLDHHSLNHTDQYASHINVHYTSGIFNKAFHDLATTDGWDINRAFEVFALANRLYWGETTTFIEGACGVINAARDRGYDTDDVTQAFTGVGVVCNQRINMVEQNN